MKKSPKATTSKKAAPAPKPKKATASASRAPRRAPKKTDESAPKTGEAPPPLPAILLEGDSAAQRKPSGPGQRFASPPSPPASPMPPPALPEAYGTGSLYLAARDPHWLYATWDLTRAQQNQYNGLSRDRHLVLRIYKGEAAGAPFSEIHLPPASRNWFAHVGMGNTAFLAVLGYYNQKGDWTLVTQSDPVTTPSDEISEDQSFRLETLPAELHLEDVRQLVQQVAPGNLPLLDALEALRAQGHPGLPTRQRISRGEWTPAQDTALARVLSMDDVRRIWVGSLEITELVRRHLVGAEGSAMPVGAAWSAGVSSLSSPYGGMSVPKSFWFNINAELIIYGATEPDAAVTIDGKRIQLRADGSFSFRFALPDGRFPLSVTATSADGDDSRLAHLDFQRATHYQGHVEKHPQDPKLKPPLAKHVA